MLGLKEAMSAILKAEGANTEMEEVGDFENAYWGENHLSSIDKAEIDAFARLLFKPLLSEVAKLATTKEERRALTEYMIAKHGLERNQVMVTRDAKKSRAKRPKKHSISGWMNLDNNCQIKSLLIRTRLASFYVLSSITTIFCCILSHRTRHR